MAVIILRTNKKIKDAERQYALQAMGINFLRFHDEEIRKDMNVVLKTIEKYIEKYIDND